MIGRLRGIIEFLGTDGVLVDVAGVGYQVFCSAKTQRELPQGQEASVLIETHIREDHFHLYGFSTEEERWWFKQLMSVNGVGAKMALSILSTLMPDQLSAAIASRDKAAFKPVSGVGPKLAERIVTELKNKVGAFAQDPALTVAGGTAAQAEGAESNEAQDAILALVNLGFNRSDAYVVVQRGMKDNEVATASELIKFGLKELAS